MLAPCVNINTARAERVLLAAEYAAAECGVGIEYSEAEPWPYLRLRPTCNLSLDSTRAALATLIQHSSELRPPDQDLSIFLGRVEEYPWLSAALVNTALQDRRWNARRGRLRGPAPNINAFAAELLERNSDLQSLLPGWTLTHVSVEKVLVGPAESFAPQAGARGIAPFDAMCWLRYTPSNAH